MSSNSRHIRDLPRPDARWRWTVIAAAVVAIGCAGGESSRPVHLEAALDSARYLSTELPDVAPIVDSVRRSGLHRRSIRTVAPSRLTFEVRVPPEGRLDLALSAGSGEDPVTLTIRVEEGGRSTVVLEETLSNDRAWAARSVDLSAWSGRRVELELATSAGRTGVEGVWGSPIVHGGRDVEVPNIVFYVIDAAGADYMSVYGSERDTTPFLRELADEAVVFDNAYSTSSWTKMSTPSFLTSLHSSVLGGYRGENDKIPDEAAPVAELLHEAGYLTALITSNPFAGTMTGLERGIDLLQDTKVPNSTSSTRLHQSFWSWRDQFTAQPYWVHFQTTDVHWPWHPAEPYLGLYTEEHERREFYQHEQQLGALNGDRRLQWLHAWRYAPELFEQTGIDRRQFFSVATRLYDETMRHNDDRLRELVEELRRRGEWERTLLIVASDHGNAHGIGMLDEIPPRSNPIMGSNRTRVPLMFVWPGRIEGGRRVAEPVSMLDILPTVLDLVGVELPEVAQGQSLAPVLLGEAWNPTPVVLDEIYANEDGYGGWFEVIDGRFGASRRLRGAPAETLFDPADVFLCDLEADPQCTTDVSADHPEEARRLAAELQRRWEAHLMLGRRYVAADGGELTQEQIDALRALGYIQ